MAHTVYPQPAAGDRRPLYTAWHLGHAIFTKLVAQKKIERRPILQVIRTQPKEILLSALVRLGQQAPGYLFFTFILAYGTEILKVSRDFLLVAVLAGTAVSLVSTPLFGYVSDRIGRKKMYLLGAATISVFGFMYFGLLNTGSLLLIFVAIVLSFIPHDMMYGPQAALIAESFTGRVRYSGASLGYQFASVIAGGPAPLFSVGLCDCRVYHGVRRAHDHCRRSNDRLHRQGH
jgi:MFS family permease